MGPGECHGGRREGQVPIVVVRLGLICYLEVSMPTWGCLDLNFGNGEDVGGTKDWWVLEHDICTLITLKTK